MKYQLSNDFILFSVDNIYKILQDTCLRTSWYLVEIDFINSSRDGIKTTLIIRVILLSFYTKYSYYLKKMYLLGVKGL